MMKKLLLLVAIAGGVTFAGLTETAKADHRGHGGYRGGHHHGGHGHWHGNYRGGYRGGNNYYRPRSGITLQFGYGAPRYGYGYGYGGGYYSRPSWGGGYGGYNDCW
ncbi:MAG: hypothetical protein ACKVT0_15220 [Planctomycetaceae bacterium]